MSKIDPHDKWLSLYARVDKRLKFPYSAPDLKGRLLLRLLRENSLPDDLAPSLDFDKIPFGGLGTSIGGYQAFDLKVLLRAWNRGIFCATCPRCLEGRTLFIYHIGASPLSGASVWTGACSKCQTVHTCSSHNQSKCSSCKVYHEDAARDMIGFSRVSGDSSFSYWLSQIQRCKKDFECAALLPRYFQKAWENHVGRFREELGRALTVAKDGKRGRKKRSGQGSDTRGRWKPAPIGR